MQPMLRVYIHRAEVRLQGFDTDGARFEEEAQVGNDRLRRGRQRSHTRRAHIVLHLTREGFELQPFLVI